MEEQAQTKPILTPTPAQTRPAQTRPNSLWVGPVALLVLLLIASSVYLFYQNQQLQKEIGLLRTQQSVKTEIEDKTISPSPAVTEDLTANWLKHTDSVLGLSFRYPPDWQLKCPSPQDDNWLSRNVCELKAPGTNIDHGQLTNGGYLSISVSKPDRNYATLAEYAEFSSKQEGYISVPQKINKIDGYQLTSDTAWAYVFANKDYFFFISKISGDAVYSAALENIISTLSLNP